MTRTIEPKLAELLNSPKKIVITTHKNPDGDAIGSSLGLGNWLEKYGHEVTVITPNPYPEFLQWMTGNEKVLKFTHHEDVAKQKVSEADIIFCLDFNTLSRIENLGDYVNEAGAYKVLIDHHPQPDGFAQSTYWDTSASSTAELVYDFIEELGGLSKLGLDSAECIYSGILTDSGSFRFGTTSARTHHIAAALIDIGINHTAIFDKINSNSSEHRLKFLGYALYEKMKVFSEIGAAYIALSQEELKRFNYQKGDTEGFVNYPLSIGKVKFSVLITEQDNEVKLSFRSIGSFSVNKFARAHFNGGGHENAAGGRSDVGLQETIEKLEALIKENKQEIKNS